MPREENNAITKEFYNSQQIESLPFLSFFVHVVYTKYKWIVHMVS